MITWRPLLYAGRLDKRSRQNIKIAVIHCTELPDMETAREWGEKVLHSSSQTGNSGHYYIDRDGRTEQWVAIDRIAHHVRGYNEASIGIELINRGRYPDWYHSANQQMTEDYSTAQIDALISLLNDLSSQLPSLNMIAGHAELDQGVQKAADNPDISIRRKLDPGPCFPWQRVLSRVPLNRIKNNEKTCV